MGWPDKKSHARNGAAYISTIRKDLTPTLSEGEGAKSEPTKGISDFGGNPVIEYV